MEDLPLKIGLAGTGIFARKAHWPAILANPDLKLTAVFSRSLENARAMIRNLGLDTDSVATVDDYEAFVRRPDLMAVDIVLPIPALGCAARKALAAGKHVLSEKPIAATSRQGRELINFWHTLEPRPAWLVSENWRLDQSFIDARRHLDSGVIGTPLLMTCNCVAFRPSDSPYQRCEWRRAGASEGGWLIDTGTHAIAALRVLMGGIQEVCSASHVKRATSSGWSETISATLRLPDDVVGEAAFVYATEPDLTQVYDIRFEVVGTEGKLSVDRSLLQVSDAKCRIRTQSNYECLTVNRSLDIFVETIRAGDFADEEGPLHPQAALSDLIAIEAIRERM